MQGCAQSSRPFSSSTHFVTGSSTGTPRHIISLKLVRNHYIQIAFLNLVWLAAENTTNLFTFLYSENFAEIEDGLFPVGVLCVRAGRESNGFVAGGEIDIKPCNYSMDKVVSLNVKEELTRVCKVFGCAGVEVEFEDFVGIGNNGFDIDDVHKRFGKCSLF